MRRSQRWNNLQICPRRDANTGGSDLWSNTLPLDHGGARYFRWIKMIGTASCFRTTTLFILPTSLHVVSNWSSRTNESPPNEKFLSFFQSQYNVIIVVLYLYGQNYNGRSQHYSGFKHFKVDGKRNFTFQSKYNVTNNYFIPYQIHYLHNNSNHQLSYFH